MSASTIEPSAPRKARWGLQSGIFPANVDGGLNNRLADVREANAHLVFVAVRAQELAEEAEKTSRLKDDFLATVSHEIRTPLSAVLGWARLLGSKRLLADRADQAIAAIERNASAVAHLLAHLFERFRQAEDATTQRHTGLGLGLGIVRQLVELHGGTLQAASPGLGKGATFTVRLPIAAGTDRP